MGQRKKHPPSLKVEVALAAIKGELTQSQLTSKYEIHTSQIAQWKKQAMNSIKTSFTSKQSGVRDDVYYKQLTTKLYEQIGRLQMELDWLKKKSEFND